MYYKDFNFKYLYLLLFILCGDGTLVFPQNGILTVLYLFEMFNNFWAKARYQNEETKKKEIKT